MKSVVVTKWLEPYVILETFKKHFELKVFNFDGFSKPMEEKKFLSSIEKSLTFSIGIYMKNVNKFYLFTSEKLVDIYSEILEKEFSLSSEDMKTDVEVADAIKMVDLAKAEFIMITKA
ncbi:MAG: hypothetical protein LKG27_07930 [Clostridiaceae bacterium]|jgi:hypothetical protein|nr:hypothetical protein [Clostridiaceae bacterium]